jgi:hypothetical protein
LRSRQVQQVWKNLTQKKGSTWEDFGKEEFQNIETDGKACWLDDLHKVKMYNEEGRERRRRQRRKRKGKEEDEALLTLTSDFTNLVSRANYAPQGHDLIIPANCNVHSKLTLP